MLRRLILGSFIICALFLSFVMWLAISNTGLQMVTIWVEKFVPQLKIDQVNGRLLNGFCADNITYQQPDGLQINIAHLCSEWFWHQNTLSISYLEGNQINIVLPVQTQTTNEPPHIPDITLPFNISLPIARLRNIKLSDFEISLFELSAQLEKQLHIDHFQMKTPLFQTILQGDMGLQKPHILNLKTQWQSDIAKGVLEISGNLADLQLNNQFQEPVPAHLQANIRGLPQSIDLTANIESNLLCFPLNCNQSEIKAEHLQLQATGNLQNYQLQGQVDLNGATIPSTQLILNAKGNNTSISFQDSLVNTLQGQLKVSGDVFWLPQLSWNLNINGKSFNPAVQWKDWNGLLDFSLQTTGQKTEQLQAELLLNELKGTLLDYPFSASTQIQIKGAHYQIPTFTLNSGDATLKASGFYGETFGGKWQINIPELEALLPFAEGHFVSEGEIQPQSVTAYIEGYNLGFENYALEEIQGNIRASTDLKAPFVIELEGYNFQQNNENILENINLKSDGKINNHRLKLELESAFLQIKSELQGGLNLEKQQWTGTLQKLLLTIPEFLGDWQLKETVNMQVSPTKAMLSNLCLNHEGIGLCAKADWDITKGVQLETNAKTSLEILNGFLPEESQMTGMVQAHVLAQILPTGQLRGEAHLDLSEGAIDLILAEDLRQFQYHGGTISALIDNAGLRGQAHLNLLKNSKLDANWRIIGLNRLPLPNTLPIDGEMHVDFNDLGIIGGFVPSVENIDGKLNMQLNIKGNLPAPQLEGQIVLEGGTVEIPEIGARLHDINATLKTLNETQAQLNAELQIGDKKLQTYGEINLQTLNAQLKVVGQDLKLIDTAEFTALITPDLNVNITPESLNVKGTVDIPSANIIPNIRLEKSETDDLHPPKTKLSSVSPDVIIIGEENDEENNISKLQTNVKVLVRLGDDIKLNVVGFESKLAGAVEFEQNSDNNFIIGNGAFFIEKGSYRAYGQDLEINQGLILFIDSPVDDPNLDIRAVRHIRHDKNIPKVNSAGILITGTAQNPAIELFSEPKVEESQILSYIVTGAAFNADPTKSSLSIGGYVRPDLYVSFGFSLFDESKAFNLRYDINEKWGIETTMGDKDQGVDFSYTLGR
ncbi:MAG: hypothetical protein RIT27_787 [Pseudomonadota bacterium]|jgi:translocation and assembly module TamB